jgi:hypothetical protein
MIGWVKTGGVENLFQLTRKEGVEAYLQIVVLFATASSGARRSQYSTWGAIHLSRVSTTHNTAS